MYKDIVKEVIKNSERKLCSVGPAKKLISVRENGVNKPVHTSKVKQLDLHHLPKDSLSTAGHQLSPNLLDLGVCSLPINKVLKEPKKSKKISITENMGFNNNTVEIMKSTQRIKDDTGQFTARENTLGTARDLNLTTR